MATEIVMPRLSDTMDRGTVAKWNKQTGDRVKRGEVLLEIETDKANMDLESYADGILARIMVKEGETAEVGAPIGLVAKDEAELEQLQGDVGAGLVPAQDAGPAQTARPAGTVSGDVGAGLVPAQDAPPTQTARPAGTVSRDVGAGLVPAQDAPAAQFAAAPSPDGATRVKASPLARRIAEQRGLDLARIPGTGPGGRIVRDDVESFTPPQPTPPYSAPSLVSQPLAASSDEEIQLSRMQLTVGRRLSESIFTAPHFYVTAEIDMTHAVRMRTQINEAEPELKVSFNDLVVKAAAVSLRKFPQVNASLQDGKLIRHGRVNIGIAVDLPGGLIVPVMKDVDRKGLREITTEAKALVAAAREAKLKPDNFEGGTFTVSNLGMFGVDQFTAIINPPESAILAVGAIQEKPVVVKGEVVIRSRIRVTLSCDHRVIYGADAAGFLAEMRRTLEHPVLALL
jgi:pyruvate dehydrogenase E2 component (dihydrolipoamide acetyltransferase)